MLATWLRVPGPPEAAKPVRNATRHAIRGLPRRRCAILLQRRKGEYVKEGLTRQIRFRVDAGSYEKLRRDAGRQGLSVSDYLRSLVMDPPDVGRCGLPLADERRSERVRVSLTPAEGAWERRPGA